MHSRQSQQTEGDSDGYGSELSLPGDGPGRTLTKQDYIFLHSHHCRQTYSTIISGTRIPVVCCRLSSKCPHHRGKEDDATRPVGGYLRIHPPGKRAVYGAMTDSPLSLEDYENLPVSTQVDLDELAAQMANQSVQASDTEEGRASEPVNETSDDDSVLEVVPPAPVPPSLPRAPRPERGTVRQGYYALEQPQDGRRTLVHTQAQEALSDMLQRGWGMVRLFTDYAEAAQWQAQSPRDAPRETRVPKTSTTTPRRPHRRSPSTPPSSSPSTSDSGTTSESDTSSSSSYVARRHRKGRKKKAHRRSSGRRRRQSPQSSPRISGEDPSKGDKEKIYGMDIDDKELLKATVPPGLSSKVIDKIYDSAVDVVSLPGMYQAIDYSGMDEAERLSTVMGVALGRDSRVKGDALWRAINRNALGAVRNRKDFLALVDKVVESKDAAMTRQGESMTMALRQCGLPSKEIKDYLKMGGLPRLIQDTFTYYMELLMMIQRMAVSSTTPWNDSQAGAMTQFHSSKLGNLRTSAAQRRSFILSVYVYLRDARAHKFNDVSMMSRFWKALESDTNKPALARGAEAEGKPLKEPSTCSHCRCPAMHVHLRREMVRNKCPFKEQDSSLARKAAPILLKMKLEQPSASIPDLVEKALSVAE